MKKISRNNAGFGAIEILLIIAVAGLIGFVGYYSYNQRNKNDTSSNQSNNTSSSQETPEEEVTPQSTEQPKKTHTFIGLGVSVQHDSSWTGGAMDLVKTVNSRTYRISFQKNNEEFLAKGGAYARDLRLYEEIRVNGKPNYVITAANEFGHLSSCSVKTDEACSPRLGNGYLFIMLAQFAPDGDASGGADPLDFSRADDKQILSEFATILATLKF